MNIENLINYLFFSGYNLVNTLLYSSIYAITLVIFYLFIKKRNLKIDKFFNLNLILLISLVIIIRVSMDLNFIDDLFIFHTPFIQIVIFSLFIVNIIFQKRRKEFFYIFLFSLFLSIFIYIKRIPNFFIIPALLLISIIIYIVYKENRNYYIFLPILSQILDGFYGNIGIYLFNFSPKHVVHSTILNLFGLNKGIIIFLSLKFFFLIIFLLIIHKYVKDEDLKEIFYLFLFYISYLAGLRSALLVSLYEI